MTTEEIEKGMEELSKEFMAPDILYENWYECKDDYGGTFFCPMSDWDPDFGEIVCIHERKYGARLSASGYLDCTDYTIHDTEKEAAEYLVETYCQ